MYSFNFKISNEYMITFSKPWLKNFFWAKFFPKNMFYLLFILAC
jgi:hypothetical protein